MKQNAQAQNTGPIKKLILNFDLNKTILLCDSAQKQTKEEIIQNILISHAWGKIDEKNNTVWKLINNTFTKYPKEPDQISYKTFVEGLLPLKTINEEVDLDLRKKFNDEMELKRKKLYNEFIKPGNPGIKLKLDYDKIMRTLTIPKAVLDELNVKEEKKSPTNNFDENEEVKNNVNEEKNIFFEIFGDGKCYLLPIFFKTLIALKKSKKEFAIIFRTFGTDLKNVIFEFNKFCSGEHPLYNGRNNFPLVRFDGSKNSKNFIINESQTGLIYRFGRNIENITLISGSLKRVDRNSNFEESYAKEIEEEGLKIVKTGSEMYVRMTELLKESCSLAFQDDHEFWNQNNQKVEYAKPMLIDQNDYSTLQIFFDDFITEDDECIVDVLDVVNGSRIPIKKTLNKYLVKFEPLDLLKDHETFLKAIEICEKNRLEEIEKIEKGITEELTEEIKKTDWEILQETNDEEYLRKTVMPLLHPALKIVDIERPDDPISFIALYLLKNKEKVKIPPPPPDYFLDKEEIQENVVPEGGKEIITSPTPLIQEDKDKKKIEKKEEIKKK